MSERTATLRARLARARAAWRGYRPSPEIAAALAAVKVRLAELREDLVDDMAAQLVDATDEGDVERLGHQVYAIVVLALPGEAAGPIGVLGEQVLAAVISYEVRALLRIIHRRAEERVAAMEASDGGGS